MTRRFHWQNLNENALGRVQGSGFWNGRCWWRSFSAEWLFGSHARGSFSIGLDLNHGESDRGAMIHCCVPWLFRLYLSTDRFVRIPTKGESWDPGREISVRFNDGTLKITPWGREMSWNSRDPWWMRGVSINPVDLIFGRSKCSTVTEREIDSVIPMPEGSYPCKIRFFTSTWKRKRWPFPMIFLRVEITPNTPIPFPGKGENSWDCGEDAMHGLTCVASNEWEAIGEAVASVMRSRCKYGNGTKYRPQILTNQ